MFCIHCGKPLIENAQFCAHCGEKVVNTLQPPQTPVIPVAQEWEYTFYQSTWDKGFGGHYNLIFGKTEYDVRLENWGSDESRMMPEIQNFLDKEWEPVGKIGPGNYYFRTNKNSNGSAWLEVSAFLVEFRRPARPRTEAETQLLGSWQETYDPNIGLLRKVGNVVLHQKLTVDRERLEFHKNKKFQFFNRSGKLHQNGVYFTNVEGKVELMHRFEPDLDGKVTVTGNRLVLQRDNNSSYVRRQEFERIIGE